MDGLKIAPAVAQDVAEIAACWHRGWHQGHADVVPGALVRARVPKEFTERTTRHLPHTFVARKDGAFAGFYMIDGDELYQFYVDAAFQGQGVAGALMASAEAALSGRVAWLACSLGNDRAAAFYKKAGWRVVKEEVYPVETSRGQQSVTVWRFEKDLTPKGDAFGSSK